MKNSPIENPAIVALAVLRRMVAEARFKRVLGDYVEQTLNELYEAEGEEDWPDRPELSKAQADAIDLAIDTILEY